MCISNQLNYCYGVLFDILQQWILFIISFGWIPVSLCVYIFCCCLAISDCSVWLHSIGKRKVVIEMRNNNNCFLKSWMLSPFILYFYFLVIFRVFLLEFLYSVCVCACFCWFIQVRIICRSSRHSQFLFIHMEENMFCLRYSLRINIKSLWLWYFSSQTKWLCILCSHMQQQWHTHPRQKAKINWRDVIAMWYQPTTWMTVDHTIKFIYILNGLH